MIEFIKRYKVTFILLVITIIMGFVAVDTRLNREDIVYYESLDKVVAMVEGSEITLRNFAVYVAHQEAQVQEQAIIYDPEDTRKYWNVHTDGTYISHAARNEAMSMAIHDELFYQLSFELDITLTDEEQKILENEVEDFWNDLVDEEKEKRLGITKQDVYNTMYKIAVSQKSQMIYAMMHGVSYEDFDFYEEEFLAFLEDYKYEVDDSVLSRIDFGDVTLVHE
ncbi:MAG: hypothetical protein IJF60_03705 [Agathobacter sp.]|nr:hypothetical protein [Agathobacter sp.]